MSAVSNEVQEQRPDDLVAENPAESMKLATEVVAEQLETGGFTPASGQIVEQASPEAKVLPNGERQQAETASGEEPEAGSPSVQAAEPGKEIPKAEDPEPSPTEEEGSPEPEPVSPGSDYPEPPSLKNTEEFDWYEDKPAVENYANLGEKLAAGGDLYRNTAYAGGLLLASSSKNVPPRPILDGKSLAAVIVDRLRIAVKSGGKIKGIRQVFRDQYDCYQKKGGPRHFILMLTVRNQITPDNFYRYLPPDSILGEAKAFYAQCLKDNPIPKDKYKPLMGSHSWALKTLLYNTLHSEFTTHSLSALFFPQVHYEGTPVQSDGGLLDSPMLHWLVLCRFGKQPIAAPEFWPHEYLPKTSVRAQLILKQGILMWDCQTGEESSMGGDPDPVRWLCDHGANILNGMRDHLE